MIKEIQMADAVEILKQYKLSENVPLKLLRESSDNMVYLIGNNDRKILRISRKLPSGDINFEHEVSRYLSDFNFPLAKWINNKLGEYYSLTKSGDLGVIFDFISGYQPGTNENHLPNIRQSFTAGKMLGLLANLGRDFKPKASRTRNIFSELERVIKNKNTFIKDFKGGNEFIGQVIWAIEFAKSSQEPRGLIHNDYRPDNVFFKNDEKINGVIDFDWSCLGPHIKDLAHSALEWSCPDGQIEPDFTIFDAFLDGYNSISTQKYTEGKELYSWVMFSALSDASTYFCDRLNQSDFIRDISTSYMYRKYLFFSKLGTS